MQQPNVGRLPRASMLNRYFPDPINNRYFPDPINRQQRPQSQANSMAPSAFRTSGAMASSGRPAQSSIPALSTSKLPSTLSSTSIIKKPAAATTTVSRQGHQPVPTASSSVRQQEKIVEETKERPPLVRRDSYTISSGQASSGYPVVVSSEPSTPDDDQESNSAESGPSVSNLLNTTVALKEASSPRQLAELRENAFRHHLNRAICVGGAKRGVLRYFGPLHMVDGLFCGIELDEPVGQHDGKFDGRRYFRAGHNRGIFAPMEKVELVGYEPPRTPAARPTTAARTAELIIPADAEFLTDVEPHLMCHSLLGQSTISSSQHESSFELNESLMFLKGSRFPGMDISMTPSQLARRLRGDEDEEEDENEEEEDVEDEEEEEEAEEILHPEDLEAAYLSSQQQQHDEEEDDDYMEDSTTPVLEQPPEQIDFDVSNDFKPGSMVASTPLTIARDQGEKTAGNLLDATMTFGPAKPSCKRVDSAQADVTQTVKERPISTISADTGYQGDTEYETQSGRSASPREMDATFERKQQQTRGNAIVALGLPTVSTQQQQQAKSEKQQAPSQHQAASMDDNDEALVNGSFESLCCETTVRDSRGRVVKMLKEIKRVPKSRLGDLNNSATFRSLLQLTDVGLSANNVDGVPSCSSTTASPSKTKRAKSESIGRDSQRKSPKSQKLSAETGGSKENSQQRDDSSRPPSGVGGSPGRRRQEKTAPPEEPVKKIVKAPPKPSKHSEIMAKLQASMAQDKEKPKREIKSKFMVGVATATPSRSDELNPGLLYSRPSLLPTPRSRASSTTSSIVNGGYQNGQNSGASSANTSDNGVRVETYRFLQQPTAGGDAIDKVTSPSEDKRTPIGDQAPTESFKVPHSPTAKGSLVKKVSVSVVGPAKNGVSNGTTIDAGKKKSTLLVKKTTSAGIGQTREAPGRPASSAGRPINGIPSTSNGSVASPTSATPRQQSSQRKSPTSSSKEVSARLQELDEKAEQLKLAKERLCNSAKGFEALSVLIRYYVEKVIPGYHSNLCKTKDELGSAKRRADDLTKANENLHAEKRQMSESQAKALEELCREYEQRVKKLEVDLRSNYEQKTNELTSRHGQQLAKVGDENEREQKRRSDEFERQRKTEIERFDAKIISLQEQHGRDLVDLKALHQNVTDDLLRRFEEEKRALSLKMDELHKLCDRYKEEARHLEATLMKDAEKKMSVVSERFDNYQREIESLRAVLEMKNQEVHELRNKCSTLEKDLEELPKCKTRIALLEQKNAELKEALDLKKQAEKLFYQQHSELLQSCERERERSQRLSMDNEQLEFKLQKLIMSQSAYETPMSRMSGDESENDAATAHHRSRATPRFGVGMAAAGGAASTLKDKPMSQSLIQIYAESSPWSPRSIAKSGLHHDVKDVPVTVYMAAQDGEMARILQFDTDGECSPPGKVKDGVARGGDRAKATAHSSSDSLSSPQTPPRGAKSVDKVSSPKRRISPLRRRNVSVSGGVAPMPATPEHPIDSGERTSSEPPPDCPKTSDDPNRAALTGYDGHDPQDPAPLSLIGIDGGKTGCISAAPGWTDSGCFTTSCTSDTQEIMTFGGAEQDSSTVVVASSSTINGGTAAAEKSKSPIEATSPSAVVNGCSKIPKKNGAV